MCLGLLEGRFFFLILGNIGMMLPSERKFLEAAWILC